jgi:hypothetical protein
VLYSEHHSSQSFGDWTIARQVCVCVCVGGGGGAFRATHLLEVAAAVALRHDTGNITLWTCRVFIYCAFSAVAVARALASFKRSSRPSADGVICAVAR